MRISIILLLSVILLSCGTTNKLQTNKSESNFTESQIELIYSDKVTAPMRVLLITDPKDSIILRTNSKHVYVNSNDSTLNYFAQRLYSTVNNPNNPGVGIAAPQVGILKNIIWVQRFDKDKEPFEVYYNPQIDKYSELKQTVLEGCLSIPDIRDSLNMRAYSILLQYDNAKGEHICEMIEDFTAVIFQHEIDHLNGILFIDHLEKEREASGNHDLK
ncbi:MAG: peptide deformylase [Bacteroidetes bacterium 4572_112]|nr:MAG: peptide deformylase [Bacteroidetes bacterium 4572_112]